MNEEKKNELGHIYGSRISKNGKWLNLYVAVEEERITIPVRIPSCIDASDMPSKPFAEICSDHKGNPKTANIYNIRIFEEEKPKEEKPKEEPDDDMPF